MRVEMFMRHVSRERLHPASGQEKALLAEGKKAFMPGLPDFPLEGQFQEYQQYQEFLVRIQDPVPEQAPEGYRMKRLERMPPEQSLEKFRNQSIALFMIHWL